MERDKLIQQLRIYAMVTRLQEILEVDRQTRSMRMDEIKLTARPVTTLKHLEDYKCGKQLRRERRAEERKR